RTIPEGGRAPITLVTLQESAGPPSPATEGASSHTRSGPVLHTHHAVWRAATALWRTEGARPGTTPRLNLSGTKDRGSGKRMTAVVRPTCPWSDLMKVVVLGAGLLGVTSAYFLRQQGHDVSVIDRQASPA